MAQLPKNHKLLKLSQMKEIHKAIKETKFLSSKCF